MTAATTSPPAAAPSHEQGPHAGARRGLACALPAVLARRPPPVVSDGAGQRSLAEHLDNPGLGTVQRWFTGMLAQTAAVAVLSNSAPAHRRLPDRHRGRSQPARRAPRARGRREGRTRRGRSRRRPRAATLAVGPLGRPAVANALYRLRRSPPRPGDPRAGGAHEPTRAQRLPSSGPGSRADELSARRRAGLRLRQRDPRATPLRRGLDRGGSARRAVVGRPSPGAGPGIASRRRAPTPRAPARLVAQSGKLRRSHAPREHDRRVNY